MTKMEKLIKRINELAAKNKSPEGLTQAEIEERAKLRQEYLKEFRKGLKQNIFDNLYIIDENGNKVKAKPKK